MKVRFPGASSLRAECSEETGRHAACAAQRLGTAVRLRLPDLLREDPSGADLEAEKERRTFSFVKSKKLSVKSCF